MAVRARMTPSHQSVEDVRRCVRDAQAKAGRASAPLSEFNEEVLLLSTVATLADVAVTGYLI